MVGVVLRRHRGYRFLVVSLLPLPMLLLPDKKSDDLAGEAEDGFWVKGKSLKIVYILCHTLSWPYGRHGRNFAPCR